jgi:hypothetical protein
MNWPCRPVLMSAPAFEASTLKAVDDCRPSGLVVMRTSLHKCDMS